MSTTIQEAVLHAEPYLQRILQAVYRRGSAIEDSTPVLDFTCTVIYEFLLQYKSSGRFMLYPRVSVRWILDGPKDTRGVICDMALVNISPRLPGFIMRVGVRFQKIVGAMKNLPEPMAIEGHEDVLAVLQTLFYQAEEQAKTAIKGGRTLAQSIPYLLFVGPYFAPVVFGPFTAQQLDVCAHKLSDKADYREAMKAKVRLALPPIQRKLYLLGTNDAAMQLNNIISSTDALAQPLIQETLAL